MTTVSASEFLELWLMQSTSSYICLPSSKAYFGTKADIHSENVIRAASRNTFVLAEDHLNKHGPQPELSFFLLRLHHKPGMDKDQTNVFYFSLFFFYFFTIIFRQFFVLFWEQHIKQIQILHLLILVFPVFYTQICCCTSFLIFSFFYVWSHSTLFFFMGHLCSHLLPFLFCFATFSD